MGFLETSLLQSNILIIRGAFKPFFWRKTSGVDAVAPVSVVGCSHFGLPGGHRVFAYVASVLVVAGYVSGFGLTRLGAFLARLRAVDEGEGEPT